MKKLIISLSFVLFSCGSEVPQVEETISENNDMEIIQPCHLYLLDIEGNYTWEDDLYPKTPGVQIHLSAVAIGQPYPEKITFIIDGNKVGYTGQVNGVFGLVVNLATKGKKHKTAFDQLISVQAENCASDSFYSTFEE